MTSASPFSSYLKTNDAPSALEADGIAALISDRSDAASGIRARLEQLAKEAKVLQTQLSHHTSYISTHKSLLSPIRRLPSSALARIFLFARSHHTRFSPIALSHVSKQWRKLALETPELWTRVGAYIREPGEIFEEAKGGAHTVERVSAFIERSGTLGLSIDVTADPVEGASTEERLGIHADLAEILEPTASRWTNLYINVQPDSPLMRLLQIPGANVPALESLSVNFEPLFKLTKQDKGETPTPEPEAPQVESMINVWAAQSLTALSLRDMPLSVLEANVALQVNWSTLTYLDLRTSARAHLAQSHVLPILAACTNLVECSLTMYDPYYGYTGDAEPAQECATLHNLRVLHLHGSEVVMRGLAGKLTLPSLTVLSTLFDTTSHPASEDKSALAELLDRFGHQLLEVSFDYVTLTQEALGYCLARLPNVVHLKMIGRARMILWSFMSRSEKAGQSSAIIDDDIVESLTPSFSSSGTGEGEEGEADGEDEGDADGEGEENAGSRDEGDAERERVVCLCPKLQRLECHMGFQERSEAAFVKLILARSGDGTQLELPGGVSRIDSVYLAYNYEKPGKNSQGRVDIVEEVEGGVGASGLDVYVEYKKLFPLKDTESLFHALKALREKEVAE